MNEEQKEAIKAAAQEAIGAKAEENQTRAPADPLAEDERKLQELISTPISKEDAEKAFADIDVKRMQLMVVRQKWVAQKDAILAQVNQVQLKIDQLDEAMYGLEMEKTITFRRTLNCETKES